MSPTHFFYPCLILLLVALFGCNEPPVDDESIDAMTSSEDISTVESSDFGNIGRTDSEALTDSGSTEDGTVNRIDAAPTSADSSIELDQAFIPTEPCERTNDCPDPQVCNENLCDESTVCSSDADCTLGYLCNRSRNRCVIACRNQSNCPLDQICTDQKCVPGTRCNSDRECEVGEMCQNDGSGGFCTEDVQSPLGDMGVSPDGGIWTCNDNQCEARQRCGPHPSFSCEVTDCLSAHGGACETNCNCLSGLICKQNTQSCVQCLNGLQCDSPERCISTGQCGLDVDLEPEQIPELAVLQTLVQCQMNINNAACARLYWTDGIPELARLKAMGCGDTIYTSAMADQAPIQDLLRCGGTQSPIILDPSFDPTRDVEVCVTERAGYYIFHGCNPDQVPLN
jgi:hypothetical protein